MIDLQIPYWVVNVCGGYILGIVTVVLFAAWQSRRSRNQVLNELSKIAVEFEAPQEGEGDAEDHHPGTG